MFKGLQTNDVLIVTPASFSFKYAVPLTVMSQN